MTSAVKLVATGQDKTETLCQTLPTGHVLRLGRAPQNGWAVPWGKQISREHADLCWDGSALSIKCLEKARNPLLFGMRAYRELSVIPGQEFQIGTTSFVALEIDSGGSKMETHVAQYDTGAGGSVDERTFSVDELTRVEFGDPASQLEILAKLPSMISSSQSDEQLAVLLAGLLLTAIPQAECVAVANYDPQQLPPAGGSPDDMPQPLMMRVETRPGFRGRFRPSRRLILKTLQEQSSVIHSWQFGDDSAEFTMTEGLSWAFCTPIRGESCRGWCLYVSGQSDGMSAATDALQSDLRFTELVAQFIGSVRQVRLLQEHKTQLSAFFSPNVVENLTSRDATDALKPAEREISVLFCDLRGFSRKAEKMAHDLQTLLRSVSEALGVMSSGILDHDGTIADFQGDAALGFWGWPGALEDGPLPACRAALDICRGFRRGAEDETSLLHGFSVGIGIVHGSAIAGQIGTAKQAKVGVFGPVVNQGSRLESLTRQFEVPICIDELTAEWVQNFLPPEEGRLRRLARVRPKGMDSPLYIYALLLPEAEDPQMTGQMIADHDAALDAVLEGRWDQARPLLAQLPPHDAPARFLLDKMAALGDQPPDDWDGAFRLTAK